MHKNFQTKITHIYLLQKIFNRGIMICVKKAYKRENNGLKETNF